MEEKVADFIFVNAGDMRIMKPIPIKVYGCEKYCIKSCKTAYNNSSLVTCSYGHFKIKNKQISHMWKNILIMIEFVINYILFFKVIS